MYQKKMLEEMSWTEARSALKTLNTVIIPAGSVEVEGPHLPLGVDSFVALDVARKVADRVEDTLVTPLVNVTYSDWHMGFPGTMSLSLPTMMTVLKEMCESLIHHGVKKFFFINSHMGNDPPIWSLGNEMIKTSRARVGMVSIWAICNELGKTLPEFKENTFQHAGEIMTSVMLAIRPDLVDMDKAVSETLRPKVDGFEQITSSRVKYKNRGFSAYHMSHEITESGVMGDPGAASREKGEILLDRLLDYICDAVTGFKELPAP